MYVDVMKVLRAKKYAKMKKKQQQEEMSEKLQTNAEEHSSSSQVLEPGNSEPEKVIHSFQYHLLTYLLYTI